MAIHPSTLIPHPLLLLVGPTGVGKTAVAVELCDLLNGEVVSADSMQIYRGCDIATAKPTEQERGRAHHHLVNIREPMERYSAAEWAQDTRAAIEDIITRGQQPIVVGGTGFYIRALLEPEHLAEVPPNPELRTKLENEVTTHGNQWLHDYLATLDQNAALRLHPNDVRRVIRAIEVALWHNEAQSHSETSFQKSQVRAITFGLDMPRPQLYERLEKRIDNMITMGFFEELRRLLDKGVTLESPVMQGLGYRQMLPALDNPDLLAECVALWKRDTRRYAKRQLTWFRHQLPVHWIPINVVQTPLEIAQQIAQEWRAQATSSKAETQ